MNNDTTSTPTSKDTRELKVKVPLDLYLRLESYRIHQEQIRGRFISKNRLVSELLESALEIVSRR